MNITGCAASLLVHHLLKDLISSVGVEETDLRFSFSNKFALFFTLRQFPHENEYFLIDLNVFG